MLALPSQVGSGSSEAVATHLTLESRLPRK